MGQIDNAKPEAEKMAIEEWKNLSSLIGRLESVEYQMRNWLLALITGFVVTVYSNKTTLSWQHFFIIGVAVIAVFFIMDLVHRMPKRYAIIRFMEVEESLRGEKEYMGPRFPRPVNFAVSEESGTKKKIFSFFKSNRPGKFHELLRMWDNTPYRHLLLLFSILVAGYASIKKDANNEADYYVICLFLVSVVACNILLTYFFRLLLNKSIFHKKIELAGSENSMKKEGTK